MVHIEIELTQMAERLKLARSRVGLTQSAAATSLGIARTTLVAIENAQRQPRPNELLSMAELYQISVGRLVASDSVHIDLVAKFRRINDEPRDAAASAAIILLNKLASGAVELERALGVRKEFDYPPPLQVASSGYLQQAEDAAIWLRNRLGVGLGRIDDLVLLLELDLGIRVFFRPLDNSEISGLYAFDPVVGACILVNSNHPWRRRMQTLAHETGHFVSERNHADVLDQHGFGQTVAERFAKRFGAAFLMPAPGVRTRFSQLLAESGKVDVRGLILLGSQFGVATEAICRRLEELDLLADGTWLSLRDRGYGSDLERSVLGDLPVDDRPPEITAKLGYLAARALDEEVLSEGQLCELLVADRVQLRRAVTPYLRSE